MTIYDFEVKAIDGRTQSMGAFRDKTLLVVNVASECGYTPQYAGLEALHRTYSEDGLVVLGFPSDQFGHQEPGTEAEIRDFCDRKYGVTFPLFSKIDVNGPNAHPLYKFLKSKKRGLLGTTAIRWNFTKFLVSPRGSVLKRYAPADTPETIGEDLEKRFGVGTNAGP